MKLNKLRSTVRRQRRAAFSLVEVTVSVGVLGTILLALLSGFTTGFFTMQMSRENLRATQILLEKMETIRLYSWEQVNTPGFVPTTFVAPYDPNAPQGEQGVMYRGTMEISDAPIVASYAPNLRIVHVTVNWTTGYLNRTRSFTSYISRYGLQDYVY